MIRRDRAREIAGGYPLVAADPATVTWLTGLAADIEWGPNAFSTAPIAVVDPDGGVILVTSEDEAPGAADGVEVRPYPGFAVEDVDRPAAAYALVMDALGDATSVAAELHAIPGSIAVGLVSRAAVVRDVAAELRAARAVKDADELEAIRAAVAVADTGQAAARTAFRAGQTELDVWRDVHGAMEAAAGGRVPVLADIVSGERTAEVGGPPSGRTAGETDLLLADLVPRIGGYWADSCATIALGEPAAEARAAHARAVETLERAVEAIRPGVTAGEIDDLCRTAMGGYPHHTGHGIGTSWHEQPRIIPGSGRRLEPGMVIALEPGTYGDGWGVRVERVVAVTESGCDVLSGHSLEL